MKSLHLAKNDPTRVILRLNRTVFWGIFIGLCSGIWLTISGTSYALGEIALYETNFQQLEGSGGVYLEGIEFYQDLIHDFQFLLYFCLVVGICLILVLVSLLFNSIILSSTGIQWMDFFRIRKVSWSEIKRIIDIRNPPLALQKKYPHDFAEYKRMSLILIDGREFEIPVGRYTNYQDSFFQQQISPYDLIYSFWNTYKRGIFNEISFSAP